MQRTTALFCLVLAACHPVADPPPEATTANSDVIFEQALELNRRLQFRLPPTMAAAEEHALELAQLARRASDAPGGDKHPFAARRLATAADLVRNELLACRAPLWELRAPPGTGLSEHSWFVAHRSELRRGVAQGWTTNVHSLEHMKAGIEHALKPSREFPRRKELYTDPPLREHLEFLRDELQPALRRRPGLINLPTGDQCFDARARMLIWPHFDPAETEAAAREQLQSPAVLDVDLFTHVALSHSSLPPHWRYSLAIQRGAVLLRHTRADRHGPAIVAAVAAGALVDLSLHRDGDEEAIQRLREEVPWIREETFERVIEWSAIKPLFWLTAFEGYRALVELRGAIPPKEFENRLLHIGALEPGLIADELKKPW